MDRLMTAMWTGNLKAVSRAIDHACNYQQLGHRSYLHRVIPIFKQISDCFLREPHLVTGSLHQQAGLPLQCHLRGCLPLTHTAQLLHPRQMLFA